MSVMVIEDASGRRTVDMAPVERLMELMNNRFAAGKFFGDNQEEFDLLKSMDVEQLRQLASIAMREAEQYAWRWQRSFSQKHTEAVEELRGLREAAKRVGVDLWSELE